LLYCSTITHWSWKPLQRCPLTWWIFRAEFQSNPFTA